MRNVNDILADQDYLDTLMMLQLEAGGVDNWEWYSDALACVDDSDTENDSIVLESLRASGVDNWEGYGESLKDYSDYIQYLEEVVNPGTVTYEFHEWMNLSADERYGLLHPKVEEAVSEPVENEPKRVEALYEAIVEIVGIDKANDVYDKAVEAGILKRTAFPKDFTKATKDPASGMVTMANIQTAYVDLIKGKKLNGFVNNL